MLLSTTKGPLKNNTWESPMSKLVGTELNAPNIMKALFKFFEEMNVPITQACFSCMANTNVNSDSHAGLKTFILHKILMAFWVGCGNHKFGIMLQALAKRIPMCC